jgi:hypothetical protein
MIPTKKLIKHKRGQFVIIAVLLIAIMIISIGALMHRAVTYYKHEPWEEYLTLIGNIELNSRRLVEISLADYTNTLNQTILKNNMEKWQTDISKIYVGRGISLNFELANGSHNISGATVNYYLGLNYSWEKKASFSAANTTFTLNITSIGLSGYKFIATAFLNLTILNVNTTSNQITLTVKGEDKIPITNLKENNFQVVEPTNITIKSVKTRYDDKETLVYIIECNENLSAQVTVKVWDTRGIQVTAKYP